MYFKCPICQYIFEISVEQRNELMRGVKNQKIKMVFHDSNCRKEYLRQDNFNTLFELGCNLGGTSWNKGIKTSLEIRKKISVGFQKTAEQTRLKMRNAAIRRLEKLKENGIISLYPNIGKFETECLNQLQEVTQFEILRNKPLVGYFPDGYIKELNLVIEFDEPHHYVLNENGIKILSKDDVDRQNTIIRLVKSTFFRISQIDWLKDPITIQENFRNLILVLGTKLK